MFNKTMQKLSAKLPTGVADVATSFVSPNIHPWL